MTARSYKSNDSKDRDNGAATISLALITVGGVLMGYGGSENLGTHSLIWANTWFASGCAAVTLGAMMAVKTRTLIRRWKSRQPRIPLDPVPSSGLPETPLRIRVLDEEWSQIDRFNCVFALKIAITNLTERPIILTSRSLHSNLAKASTPWPIADEAWASVAQMRHNHEADQLAEHVTLPALETVSGWLVAWGTMRLPRYSRPACTFCAIDNLGNSYELDIAARPQRRYRSP